MSKKRIYFDNCCFNRPYDDQSQLIIELETKAKLYIQKLIVSNEAELFISYISELENDDNPIEIRKTAIEGFFKYAKQNISESEKLIEIAEEIEKSGLKAKDSLHIACAITAKCDYFLSTDKRLLKFSDCRINIMNPIDFVQTLKEDKI